MQSIIEQEVHYIYSFAFKIEMRKQNFMFNINEKVILLKLFSTYPAMWLLCKCWSPACLASPRAMRLLINSLPPAIDIFLDLPFGNFSHSVFLPHHYLGFWTVLLIPSLMIKSQYVYILHYPTGPFRAGTLFLTFKFATIIFACSKVSRKVQIEVHWLDYC